MLMLLEILFDSIGQCSRVQKTGAVGYFRLTAGHCLDKKFQEGVGITKATISF